jgi:hypothetical protein
VEYLQYSTGAGGAGGVLNYRLLHAKLHRVFGSVCDGWIKFGPKMTVDVSYLSAKSHPDSSKAGGLICHIYMQNP